MSASFDITKQVSVELAAVRVSEVALTVKCAGSRDAYGFALVVNQLAALFFRVFQIPFVESNEDAE